VIIGADTALAADASSPSQGFQNLMPWRVRDILLVSSLYDSFTLQEDGRLNELILGEFLELSLHHTPGVTHVSSGAEALALAKAEPRFNLILTTPQLGDMDASALARAVREAGLDAPVVVLAYDNVERKEFEVTHDVSDIERIFLWQGNARILVAIVNYVEDKRNVAHDTAIAGVPVILLVEDNVRYYSSFLPTIYTEIIHQSERLVSEGVNLSHKLVRMRARPKILLSSTFEEAWDYILRYREQLLGMEQPTRGRLLIDGKPAVAAARGTLRGEVIPSPEEITQERLFALISVLIALTGISIGWFMFKNQPLRQMPRLLENKYYVDEIYDATIIRPTLIISREGLWKVFDLGVIDGLIHGLGRTVVNAGRTVRYMQIGFVRVYAAIILAGAIIIVGYFAYNGAHVLQFLTK